MPHCNELVERRPDLRAPALTRRRHRARRYLEEALFSLKNRGQREAGCVSRARGCLQVKRQHFVGVIAKDIRPSGLSMLTELAQDGPDALPHPRRPLLARPHGGRDVSEIHIDPYKRVQIGVESVQGGVPLQGVRRALELSLIDRNDAPEQLLGLALAPVEEEQERELP
jgi:hypothetical protein